MKEAIVNPEAVKALAEDVEVLNSNKANAEIQQFSSTTLESIVNTLNTKYGSVYYTQFIAYDLTDGNIGGMYIAIRNTNYSSKTRLLYFAGTMASGSNYTMDSIYSLNDKLSNLIKTKTLWISSDANSTVDLDLSGADYAVISVFTSEASMENVVCIPYCHRNTWRARLINATTGAALSQYSRYITVYYIAR